MATDDDLTDYLRVTNTVHIVTTTSDGRTISTPIWAVGVDDALRAKYAGEPASVAEMLTPLAHGTTLRVVPLGRAL